jgi:hypothetical protein
MALVGLSSAPALAQSSGSSTATINVGTQPVLSLTVSPSTVTYANCDGGSSTTSTLGFPNATCFVGGVIDSAQGSAGGVTVTNTGAPSQVDVNGANAIPSDAGTNWTLVTDATPGANQFVEDGAGWSGNDADDSLEYTNSPQCDAAFGEGQGQGTKDNGACTAASTTGESTAEQLYIIGPASSTDTSSTFTTVITWTAVPPPS